MKYQSHAPEVGRILNEINECLFLSGQNCVCSKKKPQTKQKNWVLFQRVMKQSSPLKYCLPCSLKHWFCPLTGILLRCWLMWNILCGWGEKRGWWESSSSDTWFISCRGSGGLLWFTNWLDQELMGGQGKRLLPRIAPWFSSLPWLSEALT